MKAGFTKGEWRAEMLYLSDIPGNARVVIVGPSKHPDHLVQKIGEAEFSVEGSDYHVSNKEEAEANALIFSAAPDLAEALVALMRSYDLDSDSSNLALPASYDVALAALKKAGVEL